MYGPYILKAARSLLGWKQSMLAKEADININTIVRLESLTNWEEKWKTPSLGTVEKLQTAFEKNGVEFISENGGGAGVRLKK